MDHVIVQWLMSNKQATVERGIEWLHQISFNNKFTLFDCIHLFLKFRLSGFQLPSCIVSTGSILTLWFTTDFAVSAQGFKALYEGRMLVVHCAHPLSRWPHTEDFHANRSCYFRGGLMVQTFDLCALMMGEHYLLQWPNILAQNVCWQFSFTGRTFWLEEWFFFWHVVEKFWEFRILIDRAPFLWRINS